MEMNNIRLLFPKRPNQLPCGQKRTISLPVKECGKRNMKPEGKRIPEFYTGHIRKRLAPPNIRNRFITSADSFSLDCPHNTSGTGITHCIYLYELFLSIHMPSPFPPSLCYRPKLHTELPAVVKRRPPVYRNSLRIQSDFLKTLQ